MIVSLPIASEPQVWTLCFCRTATTRWRSFVALGKYKHVRSYAYLPGMRAWLFYDVHLTGTAIAVVPDGPQAMVVICEWMADSDLVRFTKRPGNIPNLYFRLGFWCVPAIKHLIGLRSSALRPDTLYAQCLRHGGQPFEGIDGSAELPAAAA